MAPPATTSWRRRQVLAALTTGSALAVAGCLGNTSADTRFTDSFESGLGDWDTGADVPEDPNNPGQPVQWSITTDTAHAVGGGKSVKYVLDGRQDDGTIWIVRPVAISADTAYTAAVSAQAWSHSESFNTLAHLVMSLGPDAPTAETSFPQPNTNSTTDDTAIGGLREPLNRADGWEEYAFTWETPQLDTDTLYLAVGISAVWETQLTYFVDDVSLDLSP
ncbi:MAG: hypothetical protein ABEJ57_05160 [Halobacteriaceae archaeon]